METENKILELFRIIGTRLNTIEIEPIVYGSLGLYFLLGNISFNDMDLLVKDEDFDNKWEEIKKILQDNKCKIDPNHEREFNCGGVSISFLKLSEISHLAKVDFSDLAKNKYKNVIYRELTLHQHLEIYKNGLKNKWRKLKKESDDLKKIKVIENEIQK